MPIPEFPVNHHYNLGQGTSLWQNFAFCVPDRPFKATLSSTARGSIEETGLNQAGSVTHFLSWPEKTTKTGTCFLPPNSSKPQKNDKSMNLESGAPVVSSVPRFAGDQPPGATGGAVTRGPTPRGAVARLAACPASRPSLKRAPLLGGETHKMRMVAPKKKLI